MKVNVIVLVGLCVWFADVTAVPNLTSVADAYEKLLQLIQQLRDKVSDARWVAMVNENGADRELLSAFRVFGDSMEREVHVVKPQLDSLWSWAHAQVEMGRLETLYQSFRRFQIQQGKLASPKQGWTDLAETILWDAKSSVPLALARLHEIVLNKDQGDMFHLAKQEADSISCSLMQSPHQTLYNLYNSITLSELKGYTMMQFSWMLLRLYNKGNFTREAQLMHETFEERSEQKLDAVLKAMQSANRELWRCDPQHPVDGETYVQITKLLQGHVQNEVDMNRDNTCRDNCNYYSFAQSTGCFDHRVCSKMEQCKGRLLDCRYIDSDMWVCPADRISGRRYDWIEYENGRFLGKRGSCKNRTFKVDSWWRWVFWHCSYCFCLCDEQGPHSDRYFNLRPVVADIANNKVVTGLRFAKVNRIVHMQIQEGALLPHGGINESTLQWKMVDNYTTSDSNVKNGLDFHTLSWEQRAIDLDDLEAPPGYVLTGFQFRNIGTHLNAEIMTTPLNFTAGKLIKPQEKSLWISNDNTDASYTKPRTQLKIAHPDLPTNSHLSAVPDSRSDQYLLFTYSDIDNDAAQSTVPFIDIQAVNPYPPMLLAGAGIYHKGTSNSAGLIAPKVITYNISSHMRPDFSKATHL